MSCIGAAVWYDGSMNHTSFTEMEKPVARERWAWHTAYLTPELRAAFSNNGVGFLRAFDGDIRREKVWNDMRRFGP